MRSSVSSPSGLATVVAAAVLALAAVLACGRPAAAQEAPNPEQLKKMYEDALGQMKALQERKNQLAADNEKLAAQVAQLQKQVADMQGRMEEMKRTDAEHAEKTFFLRSHYAAWQTFIHQYPDLMARWKLFLGNEFLAAPKDLPPGIDPKWPIEAEG